MRGPCSRCCRRRCCSPVAPGRRDSRSCLPELPAQVELTATPFHPQTEHQCGPAALATVLGAAGHAVDPAALAAEVYLPGREGSLQPELVAAVRARGLLAYEVGPSLSDLLAEVASGRPVLVLQQLGAGPWPYWHYAVVIGYDKARGQVLLRSGTDARLGLRASLFESTWDRGGRWGLVAARARHAAGASGSGALHACGGRTRDGTESRGRQGSVCGRREALAQRAAASCSVLATWPPQPATGSARSSWYRARARRRSLAGGCTQQSGRGPGAPGLPRRGSPRVTAGHGPRGGRRSAATRAAADRARPVGSGRAGSRPTQPPIARSSRSAELDCGIRRRAGLDFGP